MALERKSSNPEDCLIREHGGDRLREASGKFQTNRRRDFPENT
jgi:hypothetical protein